MLVTLLILTLVEITVKEFMNYAKIKNNEVVKFPFTVNDLQAENPNTNFGVVQDLISTYKSTEEGNSDAYLVEVEESDFPSINIPYEYIQKKQIPEFVDGKYVIGWDVIQRPKEEADAIVAAALEAKQIRNLA